MRPKYTNTLCPPLDPSLIRWLNERIPELSPTKDENFATLMWRGGMREVVRILEVEMERQDTINVPKDTKTT